VTLMVAVIGAAFPVGWAAAVCAGGIAGSSLIGLAIGRLGPGLARSRLGSGTLDAIRKRVERRGVLSIAILRNLPIAPYAVVNIACGLVGLGWFRFLVGTLVGMMPGVLLMALFGKEVGALLADPTPVRVLRAVLVLAAVIGVAVTLDRVLAKWTNEDDAEEDAEEDAEQESDQADTDTDDNAERSGGG